MPGNGKKQSLLLPLTCALGLCVTSLPAVAQQQDSSSNAPAVQDVPSETVSAMTEDPVCTAQFEWDSVEFDRESFRNCLQKNNSGQWQELNILGWASPPGPASYNRGLSERRANTMAEFLKQEISGVDVTLVQGRGESREIGRAAQIFVLRRADGGADGVAQGEIQPPAAAEEEATAAPGGSNIQPVNPGFATGPDANPGDKTGDNLVDVSPTPGIEDDAQSPIPVQNSPATTDAGERGRDLSWLGAFGLVGLVPFLRKRRNGVK